MKPLTEIDLALEFATEKHQGQKRKYTGDDYIVHPIAVAKMVKLQGGTEAMICAALLHDTVEDTDATINDIANIFGDAVSYYVEILTDVSCSSDGNRSKRKEIDRVHTAGGDFNSHTIKLADLIHNSLSIIKYDAKFSKVYLKEKRLLLGVLRGNCSLWNFADMILKNEGY